jgi:hypothetical protein
MTQSLNEQLIVEPKGSFGLKLIAVISALAVTIAVLAGYAYLRQRHARNSGVPGSTTQAESPQPKKSPKAMVLVDEALLQGNKTIVGGTVKNISAERLGQVTVELELKRRKDGGAEKKLVSVEPSQLEPAQEGRYSLELKAQDYGSARLVGLRAGPDSSPLAYSSAPGQKRPPERLEPKTIIVQRPSSKSDDLGSPDRPARLP